MKNLFENWREYLEEDLEDFDRDTLQSKSELTPEIWQDFRLKPEIRERLLAIAENFFNGLKLGEVSVRDIVLTGSLANYNWSKYSDIDLHIIINFTEVDENVELVRQLVNAKKSLWNKAHKIFIKGYEVEVYVEDHADQHYSSGVYSIVQDDWLLMPQQQQRELDWESISIKAEALISEIDYLQELYEIGQYEKAINGVKTLRDKIKRFRQSGLELGGEYSVENLVFKVLRRTDYIGKLMRLGIDAYDKLSSLNGMP